MAYLDRTPKQRCCGIHCFPDNRRGGFLDGYCIRKRFKGILYPFLKEKKTLSESAKLVLLLNHR